ncbi:MAG: hypothetical protein CO023_01245 [Flavobacteriales bacterium CG_4_9_14_0_2_um_filter_35_242]|nr:hypothetical protein [Zetaproteobacteria bacterium]OIO10283.1 MAG: hypothetical protein AUJ53_07270 [Flavobacteriaceae bacterium CG1_02_35_72]PIR13338.1 MAG: hypothetical protein COV50_06205 [Flavobacteriales bacterium CG11_big_fil_rev_8_21_14_0_20_35_7]PIV16338.1 MAG: hypothetical protein COS42_10545 [Flavobacteriales bacterium CG03_land_8_20_14_0_80_35_15]PIX06074.1 MAG: hypothetical protein COZ76_10775 [Flavobacteriales bacterium CG_4_8_14_3_um_filter_35_10]PJA05721.1 MAG: hypothetical p
MNFTDWIGFIGTFFILLAYFLNLSGRIKNGDLLYIVLNLIGALLALTASILLKYIPFIILETVWSAVSFYFLIQYFRPIKV